MKSHRLGLAGLACLTLTTGIMLLQALGGKSPQGEFDKDFFKSLMVNLVTSPEEIVEHFELEQANWLPIAPPSTNSFMQGARILPFDQKRFPKEFVSSLIAEENDGITSYLIYVYEDLATRERVILNAKAETLAVMPAPFGYDPLWYVVETYPSISFYDAWVSSKEEFLRSIYDPAKICSQFRLMTQKEVEKYVWHISLTPPPRTVKSVYSGADDPVHDIHFYDIERDGDSIVVSIVVTNTVTNLDIFVTDCLLNDPYWDLATNTALSTNWIEWTDTDGAEARYYAAGNGALDGIGDADGDGLAVGREVFMYHTDPTTNDSDEDSVSDYDEVITYNTDPNIGDTVAPTAVIDFPTNGTRRVWLP